MTHDETPLAPRPSDQPGAYRWFYFDALSSDGERALVAIFFVGSVFSPYYARRLARGEAPRPAEHFAVNLALYRRGRRPVFVFSEYGERAGSLVERAPGDLECMQVARSWLRRDGERWHVRIDDHRVGLRSPIAGELVFEPEGPSLGPIALAPGHGWHGHAPRGRVTARFGDFALDGALGYHDENWGLEPPVRAFSRWSWGRVHEARDTRVFFDVDRARAARREHLALSTSGERVRTALPARRVAPSLASYLLPLPEAFDVGAGPSGARLVTRPSAVLERAPFYLRFVAPCPPTGTLAIGEHVDFERISADVVRRMVALRVARPERGDFGVLP